jgi:hypothetical protein
VHRLTGHSISGMFWNRLAFMAWACAWFQKCTIAWL